MVAMVLVTVSMAGVIPDPMTTSWPNNVINPFQTPHDGPPHIVPSRVEAEDYDNSGAGTAFSDTTSDNLGAADRLTEAVAMETVNGIRSFGWIISWIIDRLEIVCGASTTTVSTTAPTPVWTTAPTTVPTLELIAGWRRTGGQIRFSLYRGI